MNARSIARHYAALARGELDGVRILTPERIRLASTLQTEDMDVVLNAPVRKALGYWLPGPLSSMADDFTAFGHPGAGGSVGFADPTHCFAFALTKNRLVSSPPQQDAAYLVAKEIRATIGIGDALPNDRLP